MSKSVSVVINTYNRGFCIGNTLDSLLRLDYDNFEVIVVNGPSTDDTQEVIERYSKHIRIERCPDSNLSMSRNIGICAAAGEIVVFIDDDGIPEPEWLNRLIPAYDDPDVGGAGGWVFNHTGYEYQGQYIISDRIGRSASHSEFNDLELLNFPYTKQFPGLIGVNSSFRRDRLLEVGGFDEFFIYYLDETDVCLRLIDAGYKITVVPDAYVHHKGAPSDIRNYYMMTRSQVYYALVNARGVHSLEETKELLLPEIEDFRSSLQSLFERGLLNEQDRDERLASIDKGLKEGLEAAQILDKRKFINIAKAKDTKSSSFKKLATKKKGIDKMVICLLSQDYPPKVCGGIGRWTYELAVELSSRGHDVHVISKSEVSNTVDYEEGVWVHRMLPQKANMDLLPAGMLLPDWIKDHSYAAYKEVKRINEHHKVDVVHAPIYDLEGIFCNTDKELRTVTSLQTTFKTMTENHPEWKEDKKFWDLVVLNMIKGEAWVLDHSPYILGISQAICDAMPEYYGTDMSKHDVEVLPLGIKDTSDNYSSNRTDDKIQILYVGRLEPRKGTDILLSSIPEILSSNSNVEFNIVGKPSHLLSNGQNYQEAFTSQYSSQPWFSKVRFLGQVDDNHLNQLYANCDIFVAPSRFESFGLIFLEAMRFSKPVIGCNAGGMAEIIRDGENGLLAEPNSVESLTNTLKELINDPKLRQSMASKARQIFEKEYTLTAMADRYEKYFNRILGRGTKQTNPLFTPNLDAASLLT